MAIVVAECPVCGKRFKADERQAGKKAKCSQCGRVFVIGGGHGAGEAVGTGATAAARIEPPAPANAPSAPTKPVATPSHSMATEPAPEPSARFDPDEFSVAEAASMSATNIDAPTRVTAAPRRVGWLIGLAVVAGLAVAAGVLIVPRLTGARSNVAAHGGGATAAAKQSAGGGNDVIRTVSSTPLPPTGPAWSAQADVAAPLLRLGEDFRLAIPAQPPARHNPNSLILAGSPSPIAAVTLLPDADRPQPTVEVWNLSTRTKAAQFKLNLPLASAAISRDGGLYAGQHYDTERRASVVEVWSTSKGARIHTIDIPSPAPLNGAAVLGFPLEDQVVVLGERLAVWDLNTKQAVREVALVWSRAEDVYAAASGQLKLVAIGDSKRLTMVDLAQGRVLGSAEIPDAVTAHPRQRLSLRSIAFSPDGAELAMLFDNRQLTRRVAVFDVASGTLRALFTPIAPLQSAGPAAFAWTDDSRGFLLGSGVLLDRASGRQIGEVITDRADEGLGGVLAAPLGEDRALAAWDKYPNSLSLRTIPINRDNPSWVKVNIASATGERYEQLQCVSGEFGNFGGAGQSLLQSGRLTDGSQFLVVRASFSASVSKDGPAIVPLRPDQFMLIADGQARLPIGSLNRDDSFTLERPAYDARRSGDNGLRRRTIVFAVSGQEKSLALRIGTAERGIDAPGGVSVQGAPSLAPVAAERLSSGLFNAPDDGGVVSAKVNWARLRPFELEPDAADYVPLRVTYSCPSPLSVLAVNFDLTVNAARTVRGGARAGRPRMGLLLADGSNISPAIELPSMLPATLGAGERRTQTCLFIVGPEQAARFRLTYEGVPVATITPENAPAAARSGI